MKEKLAKMFSSKGEEAKQDKQPEHEGEAPPSYEETEYKRPQQPPPPQAQGDQQQQQQQQQFQQPPPQQNQQQQQYYDPMKDPNVIKVAPQKVNISMANPEHLNPSYPQFQQREQDRRKFGHQDPVYKHGAPLSEGHKSSGSKTGGGAFPGSSGVTYNNAANR